MTQPADDLKLPLDGLIVLDFSQFLAGPAAALRLADMGARVIKIERPGTGELGRQLAISDLWTEGDSTLFHTINRNKESFTANLKDPDDLSRVKKLVTRADVLIHNFRPGVIERLGLDYDSVRELNPGLVYASITGYGDEGPWRDKPGQDLLAQSLSGLTWLSGDADQGPVPIGLAPGDMFAGAYAVQGILACLLRRAATGRGGKVEISLMEALLDFQFEVLTAHLNDGGKLPTRSLVSNAHAYLGAPYGIFATKNGYLALSMGPLPKLASLLGCAEELAQFEDPDTWFSNRDDIKAVIAERLVAETTSHWLAILEPAGYWCAEVFDWNQLLHHDGFKALDMVQTVKLASGASLRTLRCPLRIDGQKLFSSKAAPHVGADTHSILTELEADT